MQPFQDRHVMIIRWVKGEEKMKKWVLIAICAVVIVSMCAGCASSYNYRDSGYEVPEPAAAPEEYNYDAEGWSYSDDWSSNTSGSSSALTYKAFEQRKIIRNASLSLETRNFDADLEYIRNYADELGGYIGTSSVSGRKPEAYGDSGRSARFEVRIPQDKMETCMEGTRGRATVISEST